MLCIPATNFVIVGSLPFSSVSQAMELGLQSVRPYSPRRLSGYFDAFVENMNGIHSDPSTWNATMHSLRNQKEYLEGLLSKTATTLHALRDRQTRNERALSNHPGPRSRKKKVLQNLWRTDRTIKQYENEERIIIDCLEVCRTNIQTLNATVHPPSDFSSLAAEQPAATPSSCSFSTAPTTETDKEIEWKGWGPGQEISRFHKAPQAYNRTDEIPPDMTTDGPDLYPHRLPPNAHLTPLSIPEDVPPVPPNTALQSVSSSALSPEATAFQPGIHAVDEETPPELDRLTISGLTRRFSDAAIKHIFDKLSPPCVEQERQCFSWGPDASQPEQNQEAEVTNAVVHRKRNNSF